MFLMDKNHLSKGMNALCRFFCHDNFCLSIYQNPSKNEESAPKGTWKGKNLLPNKLILSLQS